MFKVGGKKLFLNKDHDFKKAENCDLNSLKKLTVK